MSPPRDYRANERRAITAAASKALRLGLLGGLDCQIIRASMTKCTADHIRNNPTLRSTLTRLARRPEAWPQGLRDAEEAKELGYLITGFIRSGLSVTVN